MKILINDNLINKSQEEIICNRLFKDSKIEELKINAVNGSKNTSIYQNEVLYITYIKKSYIFRSLLNFACGLNYEKKIIETNIFDNIAIMLDSSRNGVYKVEYVKKVILNIALLGYTALEIYTEDTYEVTNEPYFGYLRGRYSKSELKELDSYAQSFGIELIPCIQTLAHLERIFNWNHYKEINDIDDILLVDDNRTYELIENMFKTTRECFNSNHINIGMDEAFLLGLGKYREKHGDVNRTTVMLKHLLKVLNIAEKYGYTCHMWSDMFYRLSFNDYYSEKCGNFDDKYIENIPDNIELVYWDYYSKEKDHFKAIINQHEAFKTNLWFAGGAWTYLGFLPDNSFTREHIKASVCACKETKVRNYLLTMWGDNGSECPLDLALPSIVRLAEYSFDNNDNNNILLKFKVLFGLDEDAFMIPDKIDKVGNVTNCDFSDSSKYLLYNDVFAGQLDSTITIENGNEYQKIASLLTPYCKNKEFGLLFNYVSSLAKVLSVKATIGIETRNLYKENNKKGLKKILVKYQYLNKELKKFYNYFHEIWISEKKDYGFEIQNYRLGGLIERIAYCEKTINLYCKNKISKIDLLEEDILDYFGNESFTKQLCYINRFDKIFTVNYF